MTQPFDIDEVLRRIESAVQPYPKAAMFELADKGFTSPFEQLVACILSIRTYDEVSLVAAQRLFAQARTPAEVAALLPSEIDRLIHTCTFHDRKAVQIHKIAQQVSEEYGGELPCDRNLILSFQGVGPKCANLALGIACGCPGHQRGYSRPPCNQPLGLCYGQHTRKDDGRAGSETAPGALAGH